MSTSVSASPVLEQTASIKRQREIMPDVLRGIAILLVVFGHSIRTMSTGFDENIVFRIIYSFHMPLFMLVSGYVGYMSIGRHSAGSFIARQFTRLVIPFLAWYMLVEFFLAGHYRTHSFMRHFHELVVSPENGLWFLWALFLCSVVTYALSKLPKLAQLPALVVLEGLMLFSGVRPLGVFSVAFLLPFYVLGYAAFRYKDRIRPLFPYIQTVALLAFPALVIGWHPINPPALAVYLENYFPGSTKYVHLIYNYVIAACGCAATFFIVRAVKGQMFNRVMAWIGLYTLDIYVVHYYFFNIIGYPPSRGYNLGVILFAFAVSLSLSLATSIFVFRQNRLLKFILLGQRT